MPPSLKIEICILAGGLSARMGKDKRQLRLGKKTLLGVIRSIAKAANSDFPVRTIRRDLIPRSGPMGGIYTALKTTRAEAVIFLACDMPFVSTEILDELSGKFSRRRNGIFTQSDSPGFPFVLPKSVLPQIERMISDEEFSLQQLAERLDAEIFLVKKSLSWQLFNINSPDDFKKARIIFAIKNELF